jgi:hypothetical protein
MDEFRIMVESDDKIGCFCKSDRKQSFHFWLGCINPTRLELLATTKLNDRAFIGQKRSFTGLA